MGWLIKIDDDYDWELDSVVVEPYTDEGDENRYVAKVALGSGGGFAHSAATAFYQSGKYSAKQIAEKSLKIAADLCIYTNDTITVLEIKWKSWRPSKLFESLINIL